MSNLNFEASDTAGVWIGQRDSEGPTVVVLGGVHGDELTGIEVVRQSLETLAFDTGTVILILGNLATLGRSRASSPHANLNRHFKDATPEEAIQSYEASRAQELLPYLDMSAASLDLHDFTNPCQPFIICERNALKTARAIGAPLISFGWSSTEPGGSDGYMYSKGKEGLCYELGQKTLPQANLERGHGAVARFLISQGLLEGDLPPLYNNPRLVQTREAVVRQGDLSFARDFTNFEALEAGELVAVHQGREIFAQDGEFIIFPNTTAGIGEEAFTLGYTVAE